MRHLYDYSESLIYDIKLLLEKRCNHAITLFLEITYNEE